MPAMACGFKSRHRHHVVADFVSFATTFFINSPLTHEETKMKRKIIHIDEEKCNGCGACANACHEGAIGMAEGKAKLLRDDYCDGMGDCLPECPTGAITFEEREAAAYDEVAVRANKLKKLKKAQPQLRQWPVQIKLVPERAPYFQDADLLIAADCTAYAYADFHRRFIHGRTVLIGCPKLDGVDYVEKLTEIIRGNDIQSVTVVRMELPCCGGLEMAAERALQNSGKTIPCQVVTVSVDGHVLNVRQDS